MGRRPARARAWPAAWQANATSAAQRHAPRRDPQKPARPARAAPCIWGFTVQRPRAPLPRSSLTPPSSSACTERQSARGRAKKTSCCTSLCRDLSTDCGACRVCASRKQRSKCRAYSIDSTQSIIATQQPCACRKLAERRRLSTCTARPGAASRSCVTSPRFKPPFAPEAPAAPACPPESHSGSW